MRRTFWLFASALLVGLTAAPSAQSTWRPTILSDNGMVATGHALASEIGLRTLRSGGNAMDAALAAWAAQGLVEPEMTGLGADMFILVYVAKTGEVKFINGTGFAPMAATVDFYKGKGGMPDEGPLSVSVPGAVGAVELAARTYGTRPLAELLAPAADLAEHGFPVSEAVAASLKSSRTKLSPSAKKIWFKGDQPLEMGERVVQKDLAATLREIGKSGSQAFYSGPIAQKFAAYMKSTGGLIDEKDLAVLQGLRGHADSRELQGRRGLRVPAQLAGPRDAAGAQHPRGDERALHAAQQRRVSARRVTEALKLSFADRNRWVGDPKFVPPIPMRELLSKEYAASRRRLIDPDRAIAGEAPAGNPRDTSTSQQIAWSESARRPDLSTARPPDRGRPHDVSRRGGQGSQHGVDHVIAPQPFRQRARGRRRRLHAEQPHGLFRTRAGRHQRAAARKRVRQTINPQLALKDGKPYMAFGTPGADTQPQAQLQFFLNVAEFGMTVQQALEQPSIVSTGFKSSYYPHAAEGTLQIPSLIPKPVLDELASMGHKLDIRTVRGVGSVKAIMIHPKTGVLMGGVSPTRDSYVMAY